MILPARGGLFLAWYIVRRRLPYQKGFVFVRFYCNNNSPSLSRLQQHLFLTCWSQDPVTLMLCLVGLVRSAELSSRLQAGFRSALKLSLFWNQWLRKICFPSTTSSEDISLLLLEREEGERERNISVREKHWLVAIHAQTRCHPHPHQRSNPQPRYIPWPGIRPTTFLLRDDAPNNWATPVRIRYALFMVDIRMQGAGESCQDS